MVFELLKSIEKVVFERYNCAVKNNRIELAETHPDAACKNLTIKDAIDVLVYKFDRSIKDFEGNVIKEPFPFLSAESPVRSKCDYIIFHARKDHKGREKLYVLICNMKSKQKSNMQDQLKSGRILSEFILNTSIRCQDQWKSNQSGYVPMSSNELKSIVEWKEIAITTATPFSKGKSKIRGGNKSQMIECNKTYPLESLLA
jgi:hypothetical protein